MTNDTSGSTSEEPNEENILPDEFEEGLSISKLKTLIKDKCYLLYLKNETEGIKT